MCGKTRSYFSGSLHVTDTFQSSEVFPPATWARQRRRRRRSAKQLADIANVHHSIFTSSFVCALPAKCCNDDFLHFEHMEMSEGLVWVCVSSESDNRITWTDIGREHDERENRQIRISMGVFIRLSVCLNVITIMSIFISNFFFYRLLIRFVRNVIWNQEWSFVVVASSSSFGKWWKFKMVMKRKRENVLISRLSALERISFKGVW